MWSGEVDWLGEPNYRALIPLSLQEALSSGSAPASLGFSAWELELKQPAASGQGMPEMGFHW